MKKFYKIMEWICLICAVILFFEIAFLALNRETVILNLMQLDKPTLAEKTYNSMLATIGLLLLFCLYLSDYWGYKYEMEGNSEQMQRR